VFKTKHVLITLAAMLAAACDQSTQPQFPEIDPSLSASERVDVGAVYLTSNDANGNEILVFARAADGTLTDAGTVPTGGLGTSDGLSNQASMVLTQDGRHLYVVNAGSDDISAFRVHGQSLEPIGAPVPSGGDQPVSLTVHGDLLYVLNDGVDANVSGFRIAADGALTAIAESTQPLSAVGADAAQVQFTPRGDVLVVSEKATNTITTYVVDANGRAGAPNAQASSGMTPFGFAFNHRGHLIVSEAGTGSVSSYLVGTDGFLTLVSASVSTTQAAPCWVVISDGGLDAYTTNTGSGTVSHFAISNASLALLEGAAGITGDGSLPQDADFTPGSRFLYVRNANGSVSAFRVVRDGSLEPIGDPAPIPTFANGIVSR
jgi:6-phosphogluconolactonase (cycloisomerase 2 family)